MKRLISDAWNWIKSLPWKKALKSAVGVLITAAVGGMAGYACAGCTTMHPSDKTQHMSVYALGIPGVAVITSSTQSATNGGDDLNDTTANAKPEAAKAKQ